MDEDINQERQVLVRIGTRESSLAIKQAESVLSFLNTEGRVQAELVPMKTTGDKILDKALDKVGGKGVFVKELDLALAEGRTDLSVHSLKDMTLEIPEDLPLLGVGRREDPRDVLVLPLPSHSIASDTCDINTTLSGVMKSSSGRNDEAKYDTDANLAYTKDLAANRINDLLVTGSPIGCASKRRILQFQKLYPNARFKLIRGNIETRLRKLDEGEYGALLLAAAGLKRLGFEERISKYFSTDEILPAAGQGILGIQGRRDFDKTLLAGYFDTEAWLCAQAETAFVRECNGGCSSPIAAYATITEGQLTLHGLYFTSDRGSDFSRGKISGNPQEAVALGIELAGQMKKRHGRE